MNIYKFPRNPIPFLEGRIEHETAKLNTLCDDLTTEYNLGILAGTENTIAYIKAQEKQLDRLKKELALLQESTL